MVSFMAHALSYIMHTLPFIDIFYMQKYALFTSYFQDFFGHLSASLFLYRNVWDVRTDFFLI